MERLISWNFIKRVIFKALLSLCLQSIFYSTGLAGKSRQEACNIGFIFSLPWDVSNTLRAPLAGPISIFLASSLAIILVIGLLASPLWYLFGFPPRRYHLHNVPTNRALGRGLPDLHLINGNPYAFLHGNLSMWNDVEKHDPNPDGLGFTKGNNTGEGSTEVGYPEFLDSLLLFVPVIEDECQKLVICHAHGFLAFLPSSFVRVYQFFSKKILNVPFEYKKAIVEGMQDQSQCMKIYKDCSQDIVSLSKATMFYNIPQEFREMWQLQMQM